MAFYHIRIAGHLDDRWSDWLVPLALIRQSDGTTLMAGEFEDHAALFGTLLKIRDLNLTLLRVERLDPRQPTKGCADNA